MQKVWIAGNYIGASGPEAAWRLLGVFSAEAIAEDACVDSQCFVAELPVNAELKPGRFENMRYPRRQVPGIRKL